MTYPTEITLPFADGRYRFFLPMAQVNELERGGQSILQLEFHLREGIGVGADGNAFYAGTATTDAAPIREIIRLALIGGDSAMIEGVESGVGPQRARELLDAYVYPARPLAEAAALAWRILGAAIYGNEPADSSESKQPEPASV